MFSSINARAAAVVALSAAVSNAQLTIEQMAREIRIGENFSLSGGELNFTNAKGESIIYRLGAEKIERGVNGNFGPLTAENVSVKIWDSCCRAICRMMVGRLKLL